MEKVLEIPKGPSETYEASQRILQAPKNFSIDYSKILKKFLVLPTLFQAPQKKFVHPRKIEAGPEIFF